MSWNSTFIAINRDFSGQLDKLQTDLGISLGEPLQTISWEEATSSSVAGKSLGIGSGWTIICDPLMFLDPSGMEPYEMGRVWPSKIEKGLGICSSGSKALGFILSGVSGTYGMTIHEDGRLLRCRLMQEGESLIDFGEPLPEETEVFTKESDEELRVFLLLEKFGLSFGKLADIQFTLYEPTF